MAKVRALFGLNGQFVLLPGRAHWLPVNDADYRRIPETGGFALQEEMFYPTGADTQTDCGPPAPPDKVKIFAEEARRLSASRLHLSALEALSQELQAAQAEYDLEKLISKIDFYLKQDDLFKR